ncbi:MAG: PAS domain-containing protein, partial [Perlucidibaca sp.]
LGLVLDATRAEFLKSLNSVMYLATGVAAYIQANNGYVATEQTSSWLRSLPSYNPYIRNIGLAPDNRISFVYPLEGNQKVIGVSYRDLPEQWPRVALAMQRREPVMDGPVTLLQAGRQGVTLRFLPEQEAGALTRDWHVVEMRVGDMSWRLAGRRTAAAGEETDHHAYWVWAFVIFLTMGSLQLSALAWRQRELQDSLNESLSLFRVAFQHVPHGLLVLDRRQRIVEANPLIRTLLGRPDASLRGLGLLDILADAQREAARLAMAEAADRGERTFESMLEVLPGPRQVPV